MKQSVPKACNILLNFAWDVPSDPADDDREAAVGSSNSCWPRMTPDLRDDDTESFIDQSTCCFLPAHTCLVWQALVQAQFICPVQMHHTASSRSKQLVQAHLLMQSHLDSTLYAELHRFQLPSAQEMLFIRSQHEPHRHDSKHRRTEG